MHVEPGEFVLLTGPSGCGKSTLARCLNGLIPHSIPAELAGQVLVDGQDTARAPVSELATAVGLVFQNPATQLFNLTVEEEASFGPRNLGLDKDEVARRVDGALAATGLAGLRYRSTHALSGGEQQRLAIASVLTMGPRVLVLDEPTSSLDVRSTREVMATLAWLNAEAGATVLIIEHRLGEVARLARRTVVMDQGRIVADGPTDDVFARRDFLRRFGLRRLSNELQEDWAALLAPHGQPPGPPIVELRNVEAGYGDNTVLRGLDLTLHAGEFAALWGAVKMTLGSVLHVLNVSFSGVVLTSIGITIVLIGRRFVPRPGSVLFIGLVTAFLKMLSLGGIVLNPQHAACRAGDGD